MAALKLIQFIALVAIIALSSPPHNVNALVADRAQVARHAHARGHDVFANRKRSDSTSTSGLCKPRPSSADYTPSSTPTPAPQSDTPSDTPTPAPQSDTPAPSPSSTSSSPAPSATPSSSGSSNKKWGLAWGADPALLQTFARPNVRWVYTWDEQKPAGADELGLQFMPMLWGWKNVNSFQQVVVEGYAQYALGVNEPNQAGQANMSPQDGYNLWMQYINPLKDKGYTLVSPACTDDDSGMSWYEQFFQLCNANSDCHVDIIAVHHYTTDAGHSKDYDTQLHQKFGLPVMITEFADQNYSGSGGQADMDAVWAFAAAMVDFVDNTDWLIGAFPFGVMTDLQGVNTDNALLANNQPTSLAYYYFG